MRSPNFNSNQFVDDVMLNNALSKTLVSIEEMGAKTTNFVSPGVINPSNLAFTFNNNLIVTLNAPDPFKCLFGTGAIAGAHGITTGIDSSTYSVNFTGLVPLSGSVTVYIVAQQSLVLLDPITIIGPPPGHPDYSASFVPYVGYQRQELTLSIFATTTVPDNTTSIELARTILTVGQLAISSVDSTQQVLAALVVPFINLTGDVTGKSTNNTLNNIQTKPVSISGLLANQVLQYNGNQWVNASLPLPPTSLPPSGPAGGDLSGTYPNPVVSKASSGLTVVGSATASANIGGNTLTSVGNVTAGGKLVGTNAIATNQAVMLGQLISQLQMNGYLKIPVGDVNLGVQTLIIQWGFFQPVGGVFGDTNYIVTWPIPFPTVALWAMADMVYHGTPDIGVGVTSDIATGTVMLLSTTTGQFFVNNFNQTGFSPGFTWMVIGY